jgi:hypothetical protein
LFGGLLFVLPCWPQLPTAQAQARSCPAEMPAANDAALMEAGVGVIVGLLLLFVCFIN